MTIDDILKSNLTDLLKLLMISILLHGGITSQAQGGTVKQLNPSESIIIGNKEYDVEIADSDEERKDGLSRIENLEEDEGMLFIHEEPTSGYYTMQDTSIPLDIIFINEDKEVIKVYQATPNSDAEYSCEDYKYVLEVNQNSGIREGDILDYGDEEVSDEDVKLVKRSKMLVLNSEGNVQMELEGGERIFSRIFTRKLIKAALKAYKTDSDVYYRKVAKMVFKELDAQDNRDPEYVEAPKEHN